MKTKTFLFLYFFIPVCVFAQTQKYDDRFGKVSMEEMNMKVCPIDSNAQAVVLFDIGETRMVYNDNIKEFQLEFSRHFRIKILKKEASEYGNFDITLYHSGNNYESVSRFKGVTYNLVNGKIEKYKIEKENKFEENKNDQEIVRKIAFPKVEEGSVLECDYSITSDFVFNFQPWTFQYKIPVLFSKYDTYVIDYYNYSTNISGYEKIEEKSSTPLSKSFQYTWEEVGQGGAKEKYFHTYDYKEINKSYVAYNLPAIENEAYVDDIDNYITKIDFELGSVYIPGQKPKNYSTTWEDISKKLIEDNDFGKQLANGSYMKDEISSLVGSNVKTEEIIALIQSYIFKKIKWNERNGIYAENGVKKAFNDGVGNIADINLNYINALKLAGLEVYPVVLSTRSHGRIFDWKKQVSGFNYVVAGIKIDGKYFLSDASCSSYLRLLPLKCLNGQALVINPTKNEWINVNPSSVSKKNGYYLLKFDKNLSLNGNVSLTYKDYYAMQILGSVKGDDSLKNEKEKLSKDFNNAVIDSLKININPNSPEVKETFFVENNNDNSDSNADIIYLSPCMGFGISSNPFISDERKFPVNFTFPKEESYIVKISIPEGFKVDELPSSISFSLPDAGGKFVYNLQVAGNEIVLVCKLSISKVEFSFTEYKPLKSFFDEVIKKQNERIVLKKLM